jgi:hypothetical protein
VDLKEFVSQTLTQIMEGVREAQSASTHGGVVSPTLNHFGKLSEVVQTDTGHFAHMVDFDVALTVEQGSGTKGGIGLVVGPVTLGSTGQSSAQNSSVSRVKFRVPVVLPIPSG